jgi:hypothetical protein
MRKSARTNVKRTVAKGQTGRSGRRSQLEKLGHYHAAQIRKLEAGIKAMHPLRRLYYGEIRRAEIWIRHHQGAVRQIEKQIKAAKR